MCSPISPPEPGPSVLDRLTGTRLLCLAIALATVASFAPALQAGFMDFDDPYNFVVNPHYRGFGWSELRWMLGFDRTEAPLRFWGPLTWLTHAVDHGVWGMEPFGYHLTNILLHAATAVAFFCLAARLLGLALAETGPAVRLGAAVAALFFGLHPLRVESVAWISERRDVLSGLLYILTLLAWLRAAQGATPAAQRQWRIAALGLYVLAVLAKPIVMVLPAVLLVLQVYPLRRLRLTREGLSSPAARAIALEMLPFVGVAGMAAVMAVGFTTSHFTPVEYYPLAVRPGVLGFNLVFYAWKTLAPIGLSLIYEIPVVWSATEPRLVIGPVVAAIVTVALVRLRRVFPGGLAAWVVYVVTLLPVSGAFVHNGPQISADRYSYLACLGFAVLVGAAAARLVQAARTAQLDRSFVRIAALGLAVWLGGLGLLTWQQSELWTSRLLLWEHTVVFYPNCTRCLQAVGVVRHNAGDSEGAIAALGRAVELRPLVMDYRADFGRILLAADRPADAVPHLQLAVARYPWNHEFRANLGESLLAIGRPEEAGAQFEAILIARPDDVHALRRLGHALVVAGRTAEGLERLQRALTVATPDEVAPTRRALLEVYEKLGDRERAAREREILRSLEAKVAEAAPRR